MRFGARERIRKVSRIKRLCSGSGTEADPDPNQRGQRLYQGAAGAAETISGVGVEGADYIREQEGGRSYLRGGSCPPWPPLGPPLIWNVQ